jgi:hypothetical protein
VTIAAAPAEVFARLENVPEWPSLLSDITRLKVTGRQGDLWQVELETRTLDHGSLGYHVELDRPRQVRFWRTGNGVAVNAILLVRDGRGPNETNVVYSLYIKLTGAPHLLLSDRALRAKQEHMVAVTLADLDRSFPTR